MTKPLLAALACGLTIGVISVSTSTVSTVAQSGAGTTPAGAQATAPPAALPTPDADDGGIVLPPGFRALVVADNLVVDKKVGNNAERLRGIAVAANGDVYAKGKFGGIFALRDTNGDGRADDVKEFGPGDGGTHIAFHDGWLYHSSRTTVYRYKYTPGTLVPTSTVEVVVSKLPAEKDHDAKAFAFDDQGRLLVEIGSPYNVYSEPDRQFGAKGKDATEFQKTYGGFWRFDPNKLNQTQADGTRFSTGHRHSLALAWHPVTKQFFMVQMGRDNLNVVDPAHYDALDNAERVSEVMHLLREGANLGWPYTYWDPIKKAHMMAPEFGGDNAKRADPDPYDKPVVAFPAHWAPLGMAIYTGTQFPEKYRHGAFVTFHGSWNRAPRAQGGYNVAFVPFDAQGMPLGTYETFADGFAGVKEFVSPGAARFRPAGVAVGPDGSLYISETEKGRIWRVIYTGESATTASGAAAARATTGAGAATGGLAPNDSSRGAQLYQQVCAACHMPDGKGVPSMQPSLVGSAVAAGDPATLIRAILHGPAQVLPADRPKYAVQMPPFAAAFNDADIAETLTFVRRAFANGAPAITAAEVAAQRKQR
jgi:glucose/arabinose dehydrogenase/cytochrome c5